MSFNSQDIPENFIHSDIDRWKEIIDIMALEFDFYKSLLQSNFIADKGNPETISTLTDQVEEMQTKTRLYQNNFLNFSNEITGLKECEDLQCEAHYNTSYLDFKNPFEAHLSEYKTLKKALFTYLQPLF